jgi:hypothetical protein
MSDTASLGLPLLVAEQAQKHVTHNEAVRLLDALVRTRVVDRDLTAPPGSPADGSVYIPASGASGAWSAWDFNLAYYVDGAWQKIVPKVGWLVYVVDEDAYLKFDGAPSYWVAFASGGGGSINVGDITGVTSQRVLARKSGGTGVAEEATLSEVLDFIGSAAQGDMLYRGASGWARLAAGTSGYALMSQGAGANPIWASVAGGGGREMLTAARDYYVRSDGDDGNDGLIDSAGGAFATVQKAIDTVVGTLDLGGHDVTINVGSGTFGGFTMLSPQIGAGSIEVAGAGIASTTISETGKCVEVANLAKLTVGDMKLTSSGGVGVHCHGAGLVYLGAIDFGACGSFGHVWADHGDIVFMSNYTISGGGAAHIWMGAAGYVFDAGHTVTLSGTPSFSTAFVRMERMCLLLIQSNTFSGSATGTRYNIAGLCLLETNGGGASYLPGNAAGSSSGGSQYL